jgi:peptidoglycan biosynthesis protein MviN/MurJ (putative lipid II flippase)
VSAIVFIISGIAVAGLWIFARSIVTSFAPGFHAEAIDQSARLFRVTVFTLPFTALVAVNAPYLRTLNHYVFPALGNFFFNLCLIVALALGWGLAGGNGIAIAAVAGSILRWVPQVLVLLKINPFREIKFGTRVFDRDLWISYAEALIGGTILVFLPVIGRMFSSYQNPGAYAILSYSLKFIELPLGVGLAMFSVVLLPELSSLFQSQQTSHQGESLARSAFRLLMVASVVLTSGVLMLTHILPQLNIPLGRWSPEQFAQLCKVTAIGALALPARGITALLQAILNAKGDTRLPLLINGSGLLFFVPLAGWAQEHYAMEGLAGSLVAVYWVMMIFHWIGLRKKHGFQVV